MIQHLKIKKLISAYSDHECTSKEVAQVEAHLKQCANCRDELKSLDKVSVQLQAWQDQDLTPDLERRIKEKFLGGNLKMKTHVAAKRIAVLGGISSLVAASLVIVLVTHQAPQEKPVILPGPQVSEPTPKPIGISAVTGLPVAEHQQVVQRPYQASQPAMPSYPVDAYDAGGPVAVYDSGTGGYSPMAMMMADRASVSYSSMSASSVGGGSYAPAAYDSGYDYVDYDTEAYDRIYESGFLKALDNPLSTFSIDVDTASYANMRRFLNEDELPPPDAIRIEELINYFSYDYPQPKDEAPVSITTEIAAAPWNPDHQLVQIGLQAKKIETADLPASNLVFLIDVSGSMDYPNKLPLLKKAFKLLAGQLREQDIVSIVVYAGAAGIVLDGTQGNQLMKLNEAIDDLEAGGSTAGGEGIALAYETAKKHFIRGGNNRVILATDGDFNTGPSSDAEMTRLIEEKREEGIFLTVLGFGMGNYKDSKMESLADQGNGNAAYIDNLLEAKKVLVSEFGGTLFTVAKDVKVQVEFNPAQVDAYRLIGYENRALSKEDFNDDHIDAGEMGSGHSVTVLYEIVPAGSKETFPGTDPLKYQKTTAVKSKELMTVKIRYKDPDSSESQLITESVFPAKEETAGSQNFRFATSVAEFGMLLRESEFKGDASYKSVLERARSAKGEDHHGYRAEFIKLVEIAELLS